MNIPFSPPTDGKLYIKDARPCTVHGQTGTSVVNVADVTTQYLRLAHTVSETACIKIDATLTGPMFTSQGLHLVAKLGSNGDYHEISTGTTAELGSLDLSYDIEKGSYSAPVQITFGMYLENDYIDTKQRLYKPTIELSVYAETYG